MVIERIPLSHYSRADLAEQGSSQRISAIPDFRSQRSTRDDAGSFAQRMNPAISAIPGSASHYFSTNQLAGQRYGTFCPLSCVGALCCRLLPRVRLKVQGEQVS
jgi:hypothetical protein